MEFWGVRCIYAISRIIFLKLLVNTKGDLIFNEMIVLNLFVFWLDIYYRK